jgi:hypothetical protein
MRLRIPPSRHPLTALFQRAAESLTTSLGKDSAHYYQCTARHFLNYLDAQHPRVRSLQQLRRDPHILGWLTLLRSHQPPLSKVTVGHHVIRLRRILEELAWSQQIPLLTHLIRADDIPRPDQYLPRPLTAEQDMLIQQELVRRDDASPAHWHADGRMPRSAVGLFALHRPGSMGHSCAPGQVAN